jgi:hypothetical protein
MSKMLINQAAEYFQSKGDSVITIHFLHQGCRASTIPHFKVGNRYILDTEELEQYFKKLQEESLNEKEEVQTYGKLRKIQ